jgi:hypothetical protein
MFPKMQELIKVNFPDFRRILNNLQKYSITGSLIIRDSTIDNTFISNIVSKLKVDTILDVRNFNNN